jgi:hypothetical protein
VVVELVLTGLSFLHDAIAATKQASEINSKFFTGYLFFILLIGI